MLQLHELNARALRVLGAVAENDRSGAPLRGAALEAHVDAAFARLRRERRHQARAEGALARIAEAVDRALRTEAVEYLDRPDYPERGKLAIVRGVHLMNLVTLSYRRFLRFLRPELLAIERRHGRPARILELASGAGGFALALASLARRRGLSVEITGSDIVPLYVATATEAAARRRIPATFRRLDALNLEEVRPGEYDLVFIAQSTHHFSPGRVARMIAEARRVATTGFVSIDGLRSLHMLAFVSGTSLLSMHPHMVHDAVVTARKFYSEPELGLMASLAAPPATGAEVRLARAWPLNSVLTVRF